MTKKLGLTLTRGLRKAVFEARRAAPESEKTACESLVLSLLSVCSESWVVNVESPKLPDDPPHSGSAFGLCAEPESLAATHAREHRIPTEVKGGEARHRRHRAFKLFSLAFEGCSGILRARRVFRRRRPYGRRQDSRARFPCCVCWEVDGKQHSSSDKIQAASGRVHWQVGFRQ